MTVKRTVRESAASLHTQGWLVRSTVKYSTPPMQKARRRTEIALVRDRQAHCAPQCDAALAALHCVCLCVETSIACANTCVCSRRALGPSVRECILLYWAVAR